jgi:recombination protein RecR
MQNIESLSGLIKKIPGIGSKTAKKVAIHLAINKQKANDLLKLIQDVVDNVYSCNTCHNIASGDKCDICIDEKRDGTKICVVESVEDIEIIEGSRDYCGLYHILGGSISFSEKILPENLNINSLIERIKTSNTEEIIFANATTINGKITLAYIQNLIKESGVNVKQSELSVGIPLGANINFFDSATMSIAIKNRRLLNN